MDADRIGRARERMERDGLDCLVCRLPANVLMLSGHWPLIGWTFLVFPRSGRPVCIVPACDEREAREELWDADCVAYPFGVLDAGNPYHEIAVALRAVAANGGVRVGVESSFETLAPAWNAAESAVPAGPTRAMLEEVFGADRLVDASDLLGALRARKTPMELDRLRVVNDISTLGLRTFVDAVDVGVRGVELAAAVEQAIMAQGTVPGTARRVRAFAQVSTGPDETALGYRPMVVSSRRELRSGDLALLELAVVADGFWCDRTRVRVAGRATDQQQEVFSVVVEAQETAAAAVRAGRTAGEVDEAARAIVRAAGYGEGFFHVTGHGLGLRYHEAVPLIAPGDPAVLESGMVHTVEPGVYLPGMGGIRVEDDVVVSDDGVEVLGAFPKELAP